MITIFIPQQLRSYTSGATTAAANGNTVDQALNDLDARFPGIRFRVIDEQGRIREHMRVFVDGERVREVSASLRPTAEVHVFGALSGG